MEIILFKVLILMTVGSLSAKHVLYSLVRSWRSAQEYCRENHTDLSPISNELEDEVFRRFYQSIWGIRGWIGLHRDHSSPSRWKWSGGAVNTYDNFNTNSSSTGDYIFLDKNHWNHKKANSKLYFFCFNLIVDEVQLTWEEALDYCRENHTDLTSLHSDTEKLLALTEIQHDHITERVWIGLRYLGDSWMWVDGDPLVYDAWSQGGGQDYQCPIRKRCGALTKGGKWENWDCEEKLNFICY